MIASSLLKTNFIQMKKTILSITFFLLHLIPLFAQQGEVAVVGVVYRFTHIYDLSQPNKPQSEETLLVLGQTESRYSRNFRPQVQQAKAASSGGGPRKVFTGAPAAVVNSRPSTNKELFQHIAKGKLNTTATLGMQSYLITDALPKINWEIYEEKKTLGNYQCQKAVGDYAGRTYTAWFAPELPFRNGPWKLSGLPGLILEASDAKGEVRFDFKQLYKAQEGETTATLRSGVKFIAAKPSAFAKLEKVYSQDPTAGFQGQLPANAPKVMTIFIDEDGKSTVGEEAKALIDKHNKEATKRKNNPLELAKSN